MFIDLACFLGGASGVAVWGVSLFLVFPVMRSPGVRALAVTLCFVCGASVWLPPVRGDGLAVLSTVEASEGGVWLNT